MSMHRYAVDGSSLPVPGSPRDSRSGFRAQLPNEPFDDEDGTDSPGDGGPIVRLVHSWRGEVADPEEKEPVQFPDPYASRIVRILVVQRTGRLADDVDKVAGTLVPEPEVLKLDRPADIVQIVGSEEPDVIILGQQEVNGASLKRLAAIHRANPRIVVLLSDNPRKAWTAAQVAASGASDFLPTNPTPARLRSKLVAALSTSERLRAQEVVVTERVVLQQPDPVDPPAARAQAALARVFTVASASGGSGKTVVATNLAAYLAKATGARVLLMDLDLQFGEVAPSLHLHPQRTIEDLLADSGELSETIMEHTAGFQVLCAPVDVLAAERIGADEAAAVLDAVRLEFDYVVVDTAPALNEMCLAVFDRSEKVIVTANMDVPSLKNMRRYLETIEKLDVPAGKAVLLVNRSDTGIGLDLQGVNRLFRGGFLAVLPVSREIPWATNMGLPILEAKPKSDISRRLAEGFAQLVPPAAGVVLPWTIDAGRATGPGIFGRRKRGN